jgi:hypothetical protein
VTVTPETKVSITCAVTGVVRETRPLADGSPALPPGWKRLAGKAYSPEGWQELFALRAIRIPVASVVLGDGSEGWSQERCRQGWEEFRKALRLTLRSCAQVVNWMIGELAKADSEPLAPKGDGKALPKFSVSKELSHRMYHGVRENWPEVDSQSVSCLRQKAVSFYRQYRWETRVLCSRSLPSFRKVAVPVTAKDAKLAVNAQRQALLTVRLAGQRFTLRLRGGRTFHRQVRALEKTAAGEALQGEVFLSEQGAGGSHRSGGDARSAPGANRRPTRVMATISVWLPREKPGPGDRTLSVVTGRDHLFTAMAEGWGEPWRLNEDHARRRVAAYRDRLKRLGEDAKPEQRRRKGDRAGLNDFRARLGDKHRRWLNDFLHKVAQMVSGLARRSRVGVVKYDDRERTWCPDFPWFKLRTLIAGKLDEAGIRFEPVSASEEAGPQ